MPQLVILQVDPADLLGPEWSSDLVLVDGVPGDRMVLVVDPARVELVTR
jgi:hypothetical protein